MEKNTLLLYYKQQQQQNSTIAQKQPLIDDEAAIQLETHNIFFSASNVEYDFHASLLCD